MNKQEKVQEAWEQTKGWAEADEASTEDTCLADLDERMEAVEKTWGDRARVRLDGEDLRERVEALETRSTEVDVGLKGHRSLHDKAEKCIEALEKMDAQERRARHEYLCASGMETDKLAIRIEALEKNCHLATECRHILSRRATEAEKRMEALEKEVLSEYHHRCPYCAREWASRKHHDPCGCKHDRVPTQMEAEQPDTVYQHYCKYCERKWASDKYYDLCGCKHVRIPAQMESEQLDWEGQNYPDGPDPYDAADRDVWIQKLIDKYCKGNPHIWVGSTTCARWDDLTIGDQTAIKQRAEFPHTFGKDGTCRDGDWVEVRSDDDEGTIAAMRYREIDMFPCFPCKMIRWLARGDEEEDG